MTASVLDAGALIGIERGDRDILLDLARERAHDRDLRTTSMVLAQVWRGGFGSQARLAQYVARMDVVGIDEELGRRAGVLLGKAGMNDAIDASLVLAAEDGDRILTSDRDDIRRLVDASGRRVAVFGC